jgi:hypothetical protein
MASQAVNIGGFTVVRYNIIGTNLFVHEVYEPSPSNGAHFASHHSLMSGSTYGQPGTLGKVGTRDLPADIDALPARSDERYHAVRAFHQAQYDEAYALILRAFPDAATGRRDMGDVMTHEPPAA